MSGGFKEIPTDEIMNGVGTSVDTEALPETVFAFVYPQKFQLVLGMTYLLEDKLERRVFEHERAT
jgi:hypothetical protein